MAKAEQQTPSAAVSIAGNGGTEAAHSRSNGWNGAPSRLLRPMPVEELQDWFDLWLNNVGRFRHCQYTEDDEDAFLQYLVKTEFTYAEADKADLFRQHGDWSMFGKHPALNLQMLRPSVKDLQSVSVDIVSVRYHRQQLSQAYERGKEAGLQERPKLESEDEKRGRMDEATTRLLEIVQENARLEIDLEDAKAENARLRKELRECEYRNTKNNRNLIEQ